MMKSNFLKAFLASIILASSSFANAQLIFSDVSYTSSSITFTVEGDLSGYTTPIQNYGFGIEYYGDIWASLTSPTSNSWSTSIFDGASLNDNGYTGVFPSINSDMPYSWSHYSTNLTNAVVTKKTVVLTLGSNFLNASATNPQFDFIWGWAGDEQANTIVYSYTADVSAPTDVPAPASFVLIALAIGGVCLGRKRHC
jgi:hypothetical protein